MVLYHLLYQKSLIASVRASRKFKGQGSIDSWSLSGHKFKSGEEAAGNVPHLTCSGFNLQHYHKGKKNKNTRQTSLGKDAAGDVVLW